MTYFDPSPEDDRRLEYQIDARHEAYDEYIANRDRDEPDTDVDEADELFARGYFD